MSALRTMFGRWEAFLALALVLTLVLGKPADVPQELRDRIYALGDPNRAPGHPVGEVVATAVNEEVVHPPPPGGCPRSRRRLSRSRCAHAAGR